MSSNQLCEDCWRAQENMNTLLSLNIKNHWQICHDVEMIILCGAKLNLRKHVKLEIDVCLQGLGTLTYVTLIIHIIIYCGVGGYDGKTGVHDAFGHNSSADSVDSCPLYVAIYAPGFAPAQSYWEHTSCHLRCLHPYSSACRRLSRSYFLIAVATCLASLVRSLTLQIVVNLFICMSSNTIRICVTSNSICKLDEHFWELSNRYLAGAFLPHPNNINVLEPSSNWMVSYMLLSLLLV